MSQPVQVIFALPGNQYTVIDNGTPGNSIGTAAVNGFQSGNTGFDTITSGANSQGINAFKNGTVPDCVSTATTIVQNGDKGIWVRYKNPA